MKQAKYSVVDAIKRRHSVRTYQNKPLSEEDLIKIKDYAAGLSNPFGAQVVVGILQKNIGGEPVKLGTYGVIKGASTFLGASVAPGEHALEGLGYAFEDLVLYATSLGLGTVWLGGTFSRGDFRRAMNQPDGWLLPIVSPIGYPAEGRSMIEKITRKMAGSDSRKPWSDLFFDGDFLTPLTEEAAGEWREALEMVRLAPSATNSQPWRVVRRGGEFHFYASCKDYSGFKPIDMGIAMQHFDATLRSQGIEGQFVTDNPNMVLPANCAYVMTWRR
ncbi:MAG: hypothetical protein K2N16_03825 [Muribaculaceae bacterium]|nr:hypothetical protein [Muribaculaceae bacterium]